MTCASNNIGNRPQAGPTMSRPFIVLISLWFSLLILPGPALGNSCDTLDGAAEDIDKDNVVFAGLALAGDAASLASRYPYSYALQREINSALFANLATLTPQHVMLRCQLNQQTGNSLSLALAVDYETVTEREVAGRHQLVVEISAQLLVYDTAPDEKVILAAYPLSLGAYIDTFSSAPSQAQVANTVRAYYLGGLDNMHSDLLSESAKLINRLTIAKSYNRKIGLGEVYMNEESESYLPAHFRGNKANRESFKNYLARHFSNFLSNNQEVPVLPGKVDNALGQMAYYFTGDRTSKRFVVPAADYYVDISVDGLLRRQTDANETATTLSYGAFVSIQLRSEIGLHSELLFRHQLRHGTARSRLNNEVQTDDWPAMEQTLLVLLDEFTRQIQKPERRWLREQQMDRSQQRSLGAFAEVLEKCR